MTIQPGGTLISELEVRIETIIKNLGDGYKELKFNNII